MRNPPPEPTTLQQAQGQCDLMAHCRACRAWRYFTPEELAALAGWDAVIDQLGQRMRCKQCGARNGSLVTVIQRLT